MALGDGYMVGWGEAGRVEWDTLQCVHCGTHYQVRPGSGKRRGYCLSCGGTTCGAASCVACTPVEQRLEAQERLDMQWRAERERVLDRFVTQILTAVQRDLALREIALREAHMLNGLWGV